jgi:TFIIF-interacting CTD phosphatase-like protein
MMNYLDPSKKVPYVLSQEHCNSLVVEKESIDMFVKDLGLLDRDLGRVVYIDSKPMSFWMYPDNCYPIEEFKADLVMEGEDLNGLILELESMKK